MKELLFLCHRMPYPPNKGDKIRSYHLLRALAGRYRVHLGTFIDDAADWAHRETVGAWCGEQCYRPLDPRWARLRSARGLLQNQALSFAYYRDRSLSRWVARLMRERPIEAVVVFSSVMAPYVRQYRQVRRVLDFVDVDSEKWRQYADNKRGTARWLYAREARQLLAGERALAAEFDASVFVSSAEASLFRERAPECAAQVFAVDNGVDADYFDPAQAYDNPYDQNGEHHLVFTGMMDYAANVDAVTWFTDRVWPQIREREPRAQFTIVGARPTREVQALASRSGVQVTGGVPDVRPYLAHARVSIAPMRIARGLQNKVLEALSMGKPVVMTPAAATGLRATDATFAGVAEAPDAFAGQVLHFFAMPPSASVAAVARGYVVDHYDWQQKLSPFIDLVAGEAVPKSRGGSYGKTRQEGLLCVPPN